MKELRFHPYYRTMLVTTAEDSYNIFRPNLEQEEEEEGENDENKNSIKKTEYYQDSEDEAEEEKRMIRTAKILNKERKKNKK